MIACFAFSQPVAFGQSEFGETVRPPNIIYVMADDLGYGDLGCYGQQQIKTPNLDRMASEGIRFTDHYAGHTVCRPSRLVLWTGKHVGSTKLMGNRPRSLTGTETTVAKLLQNAGYVCGGVGKWALGNVDSPDQIDNPGHPNRNGFDYWFGYMNQSQAHNYFPLYLWENDRQVPLPGNELLKDDLARGRVSSKRVTYSHDLITEAAMNFIQRNYRQPFLLHIHWTIPHANNEGGRVLKDGMEIPSYGEYEQQDWPNPEKGFAAMVTRMDRDMGDLFQLLKDLSIDENTIVFFTSDNGPHREGNHDHEFFDSNGVLKGFKRSMHEGGIRVPMIARWPGKVDAGVDSDLPSAFWDYLPTACDLAGVEVPEQVDGISFLPTLVSEGQQERHEYLYWASQEGETTVGIRQEQWKLVRYRRDKQGQPDWRLYNLHSDPGEQHDVASQHADVVERMINAVQSDQLPLIAEK
ncbi:arylsulfatase [Stieleria sp. JC731]|uniref:arylsulfatase n=1 Tax=Pirellulaceae TaxID=2691357 RepID=UPI0021BC93E5|nr:arylsulfatase [Stieleria sp. JC731]